MPHMLAHSACATLFLVSVSSIAAAPALATTGSLVAAQTATARPKPLKNYGTVLGDPVASPVNTQQRATALCPIGTVPLGGGVFSQSSSPLISVNSSFPISGGWSADVSNASAADTTFQVQVVCASKPSHYVKVRSRDKANPAATHTTISASCPAGTKPLGGGAASSSGSTFVTLSSSAPFGARSWRISENNATGKSAKVAVFALCGNVPGYVVAHGPVTAVPVNSTANLQVLCPKSKWPTGGGAVIQSGSVGAYLSLSTVGDIPGWISYAANTTTAPFHAASTVVCANVAE